MGMGKALLEGFIRGATWGASDILDITGKDGLIHEDTDIPISFIVDDDGVYIKAIERQLDWSDVKTISRVEKMDVFLFRFRGGLELMAWGRIIDWADGYKEYFAEEESDEDIDVSLCQETDIDDLEIDWDDINTTDFDQILMAIESISWATNLASEIEESDLYHKDDSRLLDAVVAGYHYIDKVSEIEGFGRSQKRKKIIAHKDEFAALIKECLNHIDPDDEDNSQRIANAFCSCYSEGKEGIDVQAIMYDNFRNARAYYIKLNNADVNKALVELLAGEEAGAMPLGSKEWSKRRKVIVCTDEKASLSIWSEGIKIPGAMVMDAQDIVNYNDSVSDDKRLVFEINHPQNGVTYIQHPMQQNVYIDAESFHSSMLERKYSELIRLLEALGATTITCDVENNNSTDEKRRRKIAADANVEVPVAGEFSAQYENSGSSSRMQALYKKLQKRIVNRKVKGEKPYVPDGLLFYPFEDDWKNLARSVLKGRRLEEETTLTYREDFAMTGQRLTSFGAKVKSVIPSYEFGLGGNFSQEFEEELKQLKSTVWHYHVCFGGEQSDSAATTKQLPQEIEKEPIEATTDRDMSVDHEKVFKMIRRLAKSENVQQTGLFSDEQRAAIESFAQKKSIADDVDDLIEEALG